jgi:hypothetical protein
MQTEDEKSAPTIHQLGGEIKNVRRLADPILKSGLQLIFQLDITNQLATLECFALVTMLLQPTRCLSSC